MDQAEKQKIIERLQQTNNVLVTVSANPSVDQLAACLGLTLFLNKMGKHATAVFSGKVPSTIEFLKPEETLEKTTDSLRDFIIALDKSKADKLRYKVEDKIVKIFITPYRTHITDKDLEFSQGDFNVDVVIGLGVRVREDLDQAIVAHGRILHDATVVSINNEATSQLGAINWHDQGASSLSEMVADITEVLLPGGLDGQMATALLTGIVSETDRFSNTKTTPRTMSLSSKLMAAGANQQLVASKLQEDTPEPKPLPKDGAGKSKDDKKKEPGELDIAHEEEKSDKDKELPEVPPQKDSHDTKNKGGQIDIDEHGNIRPGDKKPEDTKPTRLTLQPPTMGGTLTANSRPEDLEQPVDPMSNAATNQAPLLTHTPTTSAADAMKSTSSQTLSSLEEQIGSPHIAKTEPTDFDDTAEESKSTEKEEKSDDASSQLDAAREAVEAAASSAPAPVLEPIEALGAQTVDLDLHTNDPGVPPTVSTPQPAPINDLVPATNPNPTPAPFGQPFAGANPADSPPLTAPNADPFAYTMPNPTAPGPSPFASPGSPAPMPPPAPAVNDIFAPQGNPSQPQFGTPQPAPFNPTSMPPSPFAPTSSPSPGNFANPQQAPPPVPPPMMPPFGQNPPTNNTPL